MEEAEIQMGSIAAELQEAESDVAGLYRAAQAAVKSEHQRELDQLRVRVSAAEKGLEEVGRREELRRQTAAHSRDSREPISGLKDKAVPCGGFSVILYILV